jgi:hypothetical protein
MLEWRISCDYGRWPDEALVRMDVSGPLTVRPQTGGDHRGALPHMGNEEATGHSSTKPTRERWERSELGDVDDPAA